MDMNTLLYFQWITNKYLLYSAGNSARCYVTAQTGATLGKMGTSICIAESLHHSHETYHIVNWLYANIKSKVKKFFVVYI